MRKAFLLAIVLLSLLYTGTATAETIKGRFGIYGKGGAIVPLQDDFISGSSGTRPGPATGGGIIFGFTKNFAAEIDVTHAPSFDVEVSGSKAYEAKYTDVALGVQYRMNSDSRVVPYIGLGADFIRGHLKQTTTDAEYRLDWTEGGHVNLGVDYFITRGIAFTVDARGIYAFKGDVKNGSTKVGKWDPMSFVGTLGIRLMLPEVGSW